MHKIVLTLLTIFSLSTPSFAEQGACSNISTQAEKEGAFLNPPTSHEVIGNGRLYFYNAPNDSCRSKDIFVIPGDSLIAYTKFNEWLSVMYINLKTGKDYSGWVKSDRLKITGTIRPKN